LDLNGDGQVDYLRVIETTEESNRHLVLIQSILAKDIYQDIATIYVEKNGNKNVTVQVIGDAYIYGKNYVIEPVYIYRPVIYDWFWGSGWVCYNSPWYWGYWPGWYAPYPCWGYTHYWTNVYVYHYDHPRCSYHYVSTPRVQATQMRNYSSRSNYATANVSKSFSERTGMSNARELSATRVTNSSRGTMNYNTSSRSAGSTTSYTNSISTGTRSYSSSSMGTRSYSNSYGNNYSNSYTNSRSMSNYSNGNNNYSRGSSSYSGGGSSSRGSSSGGSSYSGGSHR